MDTTARDPYELGTSSPAQAVGIPLTGWAYDLTANLWSCDPAREALYGGERIDPMRFTPVEYAASLV